MRPAGGRRWRSEVRETALSRCVPGAPPFRGSHLRAVRPIRLSPSDEIADMIVHRSHALSDEEFEVLYAWDERNWAEQVGQPISIGAARLAPNEIHSNSVHGAPALEVGSESR